MKIEEIKAKMHTGEIYYENEELGAEQRYYNELLFDYNRLRPSQEKDRNAILRKLCGSVGEGVYIQAPLHANWGINTHFGNRVYANFNLTLVDDTRIEIHDDVMIGPNVTIIAGTHPLDPTLRRSKAQYNLPVVIGENVWLGAGTIVLSGVTIGKNSVIGAGSIVTKDIPENVLAIGAPCRIQDRRLEE